MFVNRPESEPQQELLEAVDRFFPGAQAHPATGFPNQVVVEHGDSFWAVRVYPPAATVSRVEWLADALAIASAAGATGIPAWASVDGKSGQRALLHKGRVFDAVTWPNGRPLNRYGTFELSNGELFELPLPDSMSDERVLQEAVTVLAGVHAATGEIARRADAPSIRLQDLVHTVRQRYAQLRRNIGVQAESEQDVRRWLRSCNRILPAASDRLAEVPVLANDATCVVHADPWPSRLMVENGTLSGVVGWQSAAAGVPILDLARLAARAARWSAETAESVIGIYADVARISPEQRRLLPVVAGLDLAMVTGTMLQAAFDPKLINDPVQSFIRSGILTSLRSLEILANVLEPANPRATQRRLRGAPDPRPRRR